MLLGPVYAITTDDRHQLIHRLLANAFSLIIETTRLRCHQIRRPAQAQQEVEGEPIL